jgi:hypothetical protein
MDAPAERSGALSVPPAAILVAAVLLASAWAFDLFVLRTPVLTPYLTGDGEIPPATPLYAFWLPALRPASVFFVALVLAFAWGAPRLADPARTKSAIFAAALLAAALALPLALFAARAPLTELGALLTLYDDEEVYFDALKIHEYAPFLRHYVELMPQLSLHGKHFPPGHASWIYAVVSCCGAGTVPIALAVLASFALALVCVYRAFAALAGERAGRTGALLLLASPSMLDFACTSLDAVFLLAAVLCLWGALQIGKCLALPESRVPPGLPLATGAALAGASLLSFSALPVGLALGLYVVSAGRRRMRAALLALAGIGASYAGCLALLWAATGFAFHACLARAIELNSEFMALVVGRDAHQLYGFLCYGNAAAFLIGSGAALVAATGCRLARGRAGWSAWSTAAALTLAVMAFGGIYFMETERIWLFAPPWLAAAAVARGPLDDRSLRTLFAVGAAQALAMETLFLTLW